MPPPIRTLNRRAKYASGKQQAVGEVIDLEEECADPAVHESLEIGKVSALSDAKRRIGANRLALMNHLTAEFELMMPGHPREAVMSLIKIARASLGKTAGGKGLRLPEDVERLEEVVRRGQRRAESVKDQTRLAH